MIRLRLPWPPSVNRYWRHPTVGKLAGRHLISEEGRTYRADVTAAVYAQLRCQPKLDGRLAVHIDVHAPDKRARDLDNLPKGIQDSLGHAGVWLDDSQIDDLRVVRRETVRGGLVVVLIRQLDSLEDAA